MHTRMAKPLGILKEEHLRKACVLHPGVHQLPSVYIMNVHFVIQCPTQNRRHLITTILSSSFLNPQTMYIECTHRGLTVDAFAAIHSWDAKCQKTCWWNHHYLQFTPKKRIMLIYICKKYLHIWLLEQWTPTGNFHRIHTNSDPWMYAS